MNQNMVNIKMSKIKTVNVTIKISTKVQIKIKELNISTWEKDSHGLYDYEADRLVKDYFRI